MSRGKPHIYALPTYVEEKHAVRARLTKDTTGLIPFYLLFCALENKISSI